MRDFGEFISVFKRALRDEFLYERVEIRNALLITDLEGEESERYREAIQSFLDPEFNRSEYQLTTLGQADWSNWADLRRHLNDHQPDLVITYRLLRVAHQEIVTSLGVYVDSMTQVTPYPVLLMPNPRLVRRDTGPLQLGTVLVATEHMYADHSLVNHGIRFTPANHKLLLCHIEDQDTFDYYMKAIEKIPELDNDVAREKLGAQLTDLSRHYAEAVAAQIEQHQKPLRLESVIEFGHLISNYRAIIAREPVSLLVFTTKDDTQLAMHSLGYSLAVEFRDLPILLI